MDTRELIDSIIASEEDSAEKFVSTMEERISDALEVRKVELASGMMGDLEEAKFETRAQWRAETPAVILKSYTASYKKKKKTDPDKAEKFYNSIIKPHLERHPELAKEEVEQVDENVASSNDSKEIRRMIARQVRGGGDTLKGGLGARLGGEGRGEISRSNTVRGPTTRKGTLSKRVQRKLASVSKEGGRITGPKGKLPEEVEQVDEVAKWRRPPRSAMQAALGRGFKRGLGTPVNPIDDKPEDKLAKRASISNTKDLKAAIKRDRANEEVEQIDELKKSTLASYVNKSAGRIRAAAELSKEFGSMGDTAKTAKDKQAARGLEKDFADTAAKRVMGVRRAAARLAKEELKPEFAKASKKHPELDRDQNHPDSLKLKAPEELRNKPQFANRRSRADKIHAAAAARYKLYTREVDEEVEQMDEAITLKQIDYQKGHKLMYKDGKQKIVRSKTSQAAHREQGWKERFSVRAAEKAGLKKEDVEQIDELKASKYADMTDRQKLMLMKDKSASQTISALAKYRKVGDINKLSPAHRTLVANYMERTGGTGGLSRSVQMMALKQK